MSFFPNQLKVFPNELMHKIHIEIWDMPINFMRLTDGWCLLGAVTIWDLHNDNNNKAETEMSDERAHCQGWEY